MAAVLLAVICAALIGLGIPDSPLVPVPTAAVLTARRTQGGRKP